MRFIGCNPSMHSRAAGFPSPPAGVIVPPGNSALTRIFSDACYDASDCNRPSRPAFDAAYAPIPGIPPLLQPTNDEVKTSEPRPRFRSAGICTLAARKELVRLTRRTSSQLAIDKSGIGAIAPTAQAL